MLRFSRALSIGAIFVLSAACAPLGLHVPPSSREAVLEAATDPSWRAILSVLEERDWAIYHLDPKAGILISEWVLTRPEEGFVDCGFPGVAVDRDHRGEFRIRVRQRSDESRPQLTVDSRWEAIRDLHYVSTRVDCASTGKMEAALHEAVMQRLALGS